MQRLAKVAFSRLVAVLSVPLLALAAFDLTVVQARMPEVRALLTQAAPEEASPPEALLKVIRALRVNRSAHVARLLMRRLGVYPHQRRMLWQHASEAAWCVLLGLHLRESEVTALFLSQSYMSNTTTGFAAAAPGIVGVQLSEVSLEQAARLLIVARAPGYHLDNPDRLRPAAAALASHARDAL